MEKRRKNRVILSHRYSGPRFRRKKLEVHICMMSGILVIFCNIVSQTINEQIDPRMKDEVITEKSEVVEG